jgi:hypothetical protein
MTATRPETVHRDLQVAVAVRSGFGQPAAAQVDLQRGEVAVGQRPGGVALVAQLAARSNH